MLENMPHLISLDHLNDLYAPSVINIDSVFACKKCDSQASFEGCLK